MNWDRARREYRAAIAFDYSARQDELERGVSELDRWERRPKRRPTAKTSTPGSGTKRPSDVPTAVDNILRSHLKNAAKRAGTNRSTLYWQRIERYRAGEPIESIVGPTVKVPEAVSAQRKQQPPATRPSGKAVVSSGRDRPPPRTSGGASIARKKTGPAPRRKQSKRARAVEEAQRRGISVQQLQQERRQKAAADLALSERAKALGISTKELRKRLAADAAK